MVRNSNPDPSPAGYVCRGMSAAWERKASRTDAWPGGGPPESTTVVVAKRSADFSLSGWTEVQGREGATCFSGLGSSALCDAHTQAFFPQHSPPPNIASNFLSEVLPNHHSALQSAAVYHNKATTRPLCRYRVYKQLSISRPQKQGGFGVFGVSPTPSGFEPRTTLRGRLGTGGKQSARTLLRHAMRHWTRTLLLEVCPIHSICADKLNSGTKAGLSTSPPRAAAAVAWKSAKGKQREKRPCLPWELEHTLTLTGTQKSTDPTSLM